MRVALGIFLWTAGMEVLLGPIQLGVLIQWQQAFDSHYVALAQALRHDLLGIGLDPHKLTLQARRQLDALARSGGFTGALLFRQDDVGILASPSQPQVSAAPPALSRPGGGGSAFSRVPSLSSPQNLTAPFSLWPPSHSALGGPGYLHSNPYNKSR